MILLATGGALIFDFTDASELPCGIARSEITAIALTSIAVFAGTSYGVARDQVCSFMWPWPRLQDATRTPRPTS